MVEWEGRSRFRLDRRTGEVTSSPIDNTNLRTLKVVERDRSPALPGTLRAGNLAVSGSDDGRRVNARQTHNNRNARPPPPPKPAASGPRANPSGGTGGSRRYGKGRKSRTTQDNGNLEPAPKPYVILG